MKKHAVRTFSVLIPILAAAVAAGAMRSDEGSKAEAVESAESWLASVDAERYGDSWDESASLFKKAIKRADWVDTLQATRAPLGPKLSRRVKASQYLTSVPGAPDGEYVVIQFESSFTGKRSAIETVTPMRDEDGAWRVSGYFIK